MPDTLMPNTLMNVLATLPDLDEQWQTSLGWSPNPLEKSLFKQLFAQICDANRQFNLTRITEPEAFWEKHLWDSLSLLLLGGDYLNLSQPLQIIDIGTGGGFPGMPIAIAFPHCSMTLLDATRKKIQFLQTLASELALTNVKTLLGRAEAVGQDGQYRETFDLALLRAIAEPCICAEYALPFLKLGGTALLYCGHWSPEDGDRLETALVELGGEITAIKASATPLTQSTRHGIYLKKIVPTPAHYPRAIGIPRQYPL